MKIAALIFGILGVPAFLGGGYLTFVFTQFGNSPYWKIANSGFWHFGLTLAAFIFCLVGTIKSLNRPGSASVWMLAGAVIWIVLALRHTVALAHGSANVAPKDVLSALTVVAIFSIPAIPALLGALFARIAASKKPV